MGRGLLERLINDAIRMYEKNKRANKFKNRINIYSSGNISDDERRTELPPTYDFESVNLNYRTRVARISFIEVKKYRTILKYTQINYVKYPIYGDWKTKTKNITKTVKLTNDVLENLKSSDEELIRKFASDIVGHIGNKLYCPSWFIREMLTQEKAEKISSVRKPFDDAINYKNQVIKQNDKIISTYNCDLKEHKRVLNEQNIKFQHKEKQINSAKNKKKGIAIKFLTLGLYSFLHSNYRINRLTKKKDSINEKIKNTQSSIAAIEREISFYETKNNDLFEEIKKVKKEQSGKITEVQYEYNDKFRAIKPLTTDFDDQNEHFISLKELCGMNYEKIIGCYVIRNKENGKCYVGQSKDVIKRVCRQHFNGTDIKKIEFAEDYYNSKYQDKSELFEVKIIPLETKDELDETEKELIELYDSYKNGYNSTSGNE